MLFSPLLSGSANRAADLSNAHAPLLVPGSDHGAGAVSRVVADGGQVLAGGAGEALGPFHFSTTFTSWGLDPIPFVVFVWATALYLFGVRTLRRRGDSWPVGRTVMWLLGMGAFFFATSSGLAVYDTTLISVHMVQHMILSMVVPLACAMGAPVTLALRTLPPRLRRILLAVVQSRVAKVLSFPPLAFALYVLSPWALYFTGWYEATLNSAYVHQMMHIHLVLTGTLFFSPMVGVDPLPNRLGYPARMLLSVLTLPFHAFLGVTIMGQSTLIAADYYTQLREGPMGAWLPDAMDDQHLAGGILWASGDAIGLIFFAALFGQWVRQSMAEAKREDRRLDRLERAEARSGEVAGPAAAAGGSTAGAVGGPTAADAGGASEGDANRLDA